MTPRWGCHPRERRSGSRAPIRAGQRVPHNDKRIDVSNNDFERPGSVIRLALHVRAEEILAAALKAQGRDPGSYSADEYMIAVREAERESAPETARSMPESLRSRVGSERQRLLNALANFAMEKLDRDGVEFTPERYIAALERLESEVLQADSKDGMTLEERVSALERKPKS
jgi:hypothetical protein